MVVVGDVIFVVAIGGEAGVQVEGIHAQVLQVVQVLLDAR